MRTIKGLLCATALVAGLATSMAQSNVYSLNVVGYVNQTVQAGHWYMWGNPLSNGANDTGTVLTNWVSTSGNPADWNGATVYCWNKPGPQGGYGNPDQYYYDLPDTYVQWYEAGNCDLTPGNGFWFYAPCSGTVTFVGQVVTTNKFQLSSAQSGWNMVSSAFPIATNLTQLGLIGSGPVSQSLTGDFIYRYGWAPGYPGGYDNGIAYYNDPVDSFVGWYDGDSLDTTGTGFNGPALGVGEGIWYYKWGSSVTWTQTFTIQ